MIPIVQLDSESSSFSGESLCGGCNLASVCLGVGGGFQQSSWKNYVETDPSGPDVLIELVDVQGSLLPKLKNNASGKSGKSR